MSPQLDLPPDPRRPHPLLAPVSRSACGWKLSIDRNTFIEHLREQGVGCSVHWRPLHLHPYYKENFAWRPEHLPTASAQWPKLISLPLFPGMRDDECNHVVRVVRALCRDYGRGR